MTNYPKHLYDPIRRKIAEDYLSHEFRKFFSTVNDEETWKKMDAEIAIWFEGHHTFAPVRDFWNALHGISRGFKLKNIVSWLTSENISWSEEEMEVSELSFGVNFEEFEGLRKQPTAMEVKELLQTLNEAEVEKIKERYLEKLAHKNEVDEFPVIAVEREGRLIVSDGNRRLFRALLLDLKTVKAAVGRKLADPIVFNEWVPTPLLMDLVSFSRNGQVRNPVSMEAVAEVIAGLIVNSEAGRVEFFERSVDLKHESDMVLVTLVKEKIGA